jgi:transcriptional regulator with XRE-family HTH domain
MSAEHKKEATTRATGRRYASVSEMVQKMDAGPDVKKALKELERETAVCQVLTQIRVSAGLTQDQFAERAGVTQGAVSKWETGPDTDLAVSTISKYVEIGGAQLHLAFGKPLNHAESVKFHAFQIKDHLLALASLARDDEELESAIRGFFGEAYFNLIEIVTKCHQELPHTPKGGGIQASLITPPLTRA